MKKLSERDLAIISHLRQDGRKSLKVIGRETQIPISTVYERLKLLRKSCLIKPTVLLNFAAFGFMVRVLIALKLDREMRSKAEEYLAANVHVNTVYRVNNGFIIFADCIFQSLQEAEDFLEQLDQFKVRKKMVFYVLSELKREEFLSNPP